MPLKFFLGGYSNYERTIFTNQSANQGATQANRIVTYANGTPLRVCVIGVLFKLAKQKLFLR